jgi:hypothetical protein
MITGIQKATPIKAKANPMAATWTKAGKVRRAFKAGKPRQKDLNLAPRPAIWEACLLRENIGAAMTGAGLSADDVQVAIVLMTPDASSGVDWVHVLPIPQTKDLPELFTKVAKLEKADHVVPLGVAIRQIDREAYEPKDPKSGAVVWVQPFLVNPRAARALIAARQIFADERGGKGEFS